MSYYTFLKGGPYSQPRSLHFFSQMKKNILIEISVAVLSSLKILLNIKENFRELATHLPELDYLSYIYFEQ